MTDSTQQSVRPLPAIISAVQADHLTYLDDDALADLFDRMEEIERQRLGGLVIEAGCALGGSAIVIATAKCPARPFYIYDAFGMIPPPSDRDGPDVHERYQAIQNGQSEGISGNRYYGYEANLLEKVRDNFSRHGIALEATTTYLVKGLFQDTILVDEPVALAHIDGDWYESVMTCLTRLSPRLVPGGVLVIDDYHDWSGCRKAVDEYFADKRSDFYFVQRARLQIVRTEKCANGTLSPHLLS